MRVLILFFFAVILCNTIIAKDENVHRRLMEYAHPTPKKYPKAESPVLMSSKKQLPYFFNIMTTVTEEDYAYKMQNESSIAVNPTNPSNIIASSVDYRDNSATWIYVSDDGGHSWRNINLNRPFEGWRASNDPSVAFSSDGIGYLVYGGFGNTADSSGVLFGENGVFISRSFDEGVTWEAHIPIIVHRGQQSPDSTFEDKYYIEVDNSPDSPYLHHLYNPWKRVTPRDSATQIVISKSIDSGATWSRPVGVSHRLSGTSEDTTYGQSFPLTTTGPNGEVYLVWNHGTEHAVGFSKSLDGGETWTEPRLIQRYNIFGETKYLPGQGYRHSVKGKVRAETYPVIVCDITNGENRGNLYLTWAGDRVPNIYFSRSTDRGETWSDPQIIHSDKTNDQFWQWMAVDPMNGDVGVMYFDSRNDPENLLVECYISYSSDGGETWIDRQISDRGTDLRLNPFQGNSFAGDYSGLDFYNGILYPSWVDMRAAENDLRDSDVFTAIVNVKAPAPVNQFEVKVKPKEPEILALGWIPPTQYSFGQPLANEDYSIKLLRNNEFYKEFPGGTSSFTDSALTPYTKYKYDIYCVTERDSSIMRSDSAFAGGVSSPGKPFISDVTGKVNKEVNIEVFIPSKRADESTPFVNLNGINLYRDEQLINTFDASANDTGSTVTLIDIPNNKGFYKYYVSVTDKYQDITNESKYSNTVITYTGENHSYWEEFFNDLPLPKYFRSGKWQVTDEIAYEGDYSVTIAPFDEYQPNQSDTLILFPFEIKEDYEKYYLHFMNIAEVFRNDKALIEISFDDMKTWSQIASYDEDMYEYWTDGVINANDWKFEFIEIPLKDNKDSERFFLRFRFESNAFAESNGWYIDKLICEAITTGINIDNQAEMMKVYPNPASDIVTIRNSNIFYKSIDDILIYNIYGNPVDFSSKVIQISKNELKLDISALPTGTYIVEIREKDRIIREKLSIVR